MHLPFWLCTGLLSPVLMAQALHTRRTTLRLPEADGARHGQWGHGAPSQRLLVIGESTAAGVGVEYQRQGLASQLARQLYQSRGVSVQWHTAGVNGARAGALINTANDLRIAPVDHIFISLGVNDTTGLTRRQAYYHQLLTLSHALKRHSPAARQYLLAVPPMHRFTALPSPLRQLLGWRARQLDEKQKQLAGQPPGYLQHIHYPELEPPSLLAEDGYHPGPRGYRAMAKAVAAQLWD